MVDALFLASALLVFASAAWRVWVRRHGRRKAIDGALLTITIAGASALVFIAPSVQVIASAITPALGRLLSNLSTLTCAYGFVCLVLHVKYDAEEARRAARRRLVVLLLAAVVMTVMFLVSSPPTNGLFGGLYDQQPGLAVYAAVYVVYLAVAVSDGASLSLRALPHTRSWLRAGLGLIALGCVLAVVYLGEKVVSIGSELIAEPDTGETYCPSPFAGFGCTASVGLPPIFAAALILGASLPVIGPRLARPVQAARAWRSYRTLEPLWTLLHEALPELDSATPSGQPTTTNERLYNRVISIRDHLLALQPHRSAEDTRQHQTQAQQLPARRRPAAVEAADLRSAIARLEAGELPVSDPVTGPRHNDLASEIRWLTRVAAAMNRGEVEHRRPEPVDS
ncbi:MAB_1171c family putative transporter (plasmid) [Saccharopolyspora sp. ID03-671]|uniref:MAB_1171c family putative transporter n=1 Tax=Saccharopolyspora sp. ID03-671 TaxID=3073066 RepID=UPI0030F4A591